MPSKYHSRPTEMDGVVFHSQREARRYSELKMLERSKIIRDLELQPKFLITINGYKICTYIADFRYRDQADRVVVEDSKGFATPVYKLKRKLVEAVHGVRIVEV